MIQKKTIVKQPYQTTNYYFKLEKSCPFLCCVLIGGSWATKFNENRNSSTIGFPQKSVFESTLARKKTSDVSRQCLNFDPQKIS